MSMAIDPRSLPFERKKFCVYLYRDPRPGKKHVPIYIGKGLTISRPDLHWKFRSHNAGLNSLFKELRKSGLIPPCEYVEFFDDEGMALRLERILIGRVGRIDLGTGPLFNRRLGTTYRLQPKPRIKKLFCAVQVSLEERDAIAAAAQADERSISSFVRRILLNALRTSSYLKDDTDARDLRK